MSNPVVATVENSPLQVALSATEPGCSSLTYTLLSSPSHGTLSGTVPNLTYTPSPDFSGTDSFLFQADDGQGGVATGTVSITVLPLQIQVDPASVATQLQQTVTVLQDSGMLQPVTLATSTADQATAALDAVGGLGATSSAVPVEVGVDLGSTVFTPAAPIAVPDGVQMTLTGSGTSTAVVNNATIGSGSVVVDQGVTPTNWTIAGGNVEIGTTGTASGFTVDDGNVTVDASATPTDWRVNGGNVVAQGTATAGDFVVNGGTVTLADGTVLTGHSPALIVNGGTVYLQGVTAQTDTAAPTIIVNSGSLVVRGSTVAESTNSDQVAILINGGTVDLGTSTDPGDNTIDVNGDGQLVCNLTSNPVPDFGDTFNYPVDGTTVSASQLSFTTLSASPSASVYGQTVAFTATLRQGDASQGTPTGDVDFIDTTTGTVLGSEKLTNGVATLTTSALGVGSHDIMAHYEGDGTFAFSLDSLTQTVAMADQTISFGTLADKTYGDAAFTPTATASSGLSPTFVVVSGAATYDGASNTITIIGTGQVVIRASQPGDGNYNPAPDVVQAFDVACAPLTITANNLTKVYGQANPVLTVSYSGFVNGDTFASLTTPPTQTTTATTTSHVGTYTINASGAADQDYTITYVSGTLTVNPATLTVTATSQSDTYGFGGNSAALGTTGFTTSGLVGSDSVTGITLSTNDGTSTSGNYKAGTYNLTPSAATGSGLSNYTLTYVTDTNGLVVATKALTITGVTANNKVYNGTNAATLTTTSAAFSGAVSGDSIQRVSGYGDVQQRERGHGDRGDGDGVLGFRNRCR